MDEVFEHRKDLKGHASAVYALAADDKLLYSGSGDGMLASWYLDSLEPAPFSVKVGKPVYAVAIHGDSLYIGQSEGGLHVIDRHQKKELHHIQIHKKGIFDILVDSEGNRLFTAGGDGSIGIFDLADMRLLLHIPLAQNKMRALTLTPDGSKLLVSSSNGFIYVLETSYFNELYNFEAHPKGAYGMTWLDEDTLVTGGRDAYLRFWELGLENAEQKDAIPAHNFAIYQVAINTDGLMATGSRDKMVKLWSSKELKKPQRLLESLTTTHRNSVNDVLWADNKLFSASDDQVIKVWARSGS